ncbi:MAG TPA: biopolymer transporter ExbD [Spirochaetota bacterium]
MRKRRHYENRIISDVNITPLVDTCLVLLIMFMIATPLLVTQAVPVTLPKSGQGVKVSMHNESFITITYSKESGTSYYYLQDKTPISLEKLGEIISKRINPDKKETVYIYSDGKAPMDSVIAAVDVITSKGGKVSLITTQGK